MSTASAGVPAVPRGGQNPLALLKYLGPAPIIDGEDGEAYNRILEQIAANVAPKDPIEEIWLRDIVDLTWECVRWRRYSANLVSGLINDGLMQMLQPLVGGGEAVRLSDGYQKRDEQAMAQLEDVLKAAEMTMDSLATHALARQNMHIERLQAFDRLAAAAEARRNAALREIAKHRVGFAEELEAASEEVQDAEFEEIGPAKSAAVTGRGTRDAKNGADRAIGTADDADGRAER